MGVGGFGLRVCWRRFLFDLRWRGWVLALAFDGHGKVSIPDILLFYFLLAGSVYTL